mgnify:CR=1 FL=1
MEQKKYLHTTEELDLVLDREKELAIYGAGDFGKRLADYILEVRREQQEKIISFLVTERKKTDYDYHGIAVTAAPDFLADRECFIIVAVSDRQQGDIVKVVEGYGRRLCCLTENLYQTLVQKLEVPYHGLDFLLAGFPKCATTSLYGALKTVDDIFLPKGKETLFNTWYGKTENAENVLAEKYYSGIRGNQLTGAIEPGIFMRYTGWQGAESVYEIFGPQLKLMFSVRNPVEAAFSEFKMMVRNGDEYCNNAYQKYQCFSMEMFDEFIDTSVELENFKYIHWIKEFGNYYPREQIKVVLFEELVHDAGKVVDDVLRFAGSKCKFRSAEFPFWNKGDFVPADKEGWEKGKQLNQLRFYSKYNPQTKEPESDSILRSRSEYEEREKIYHPQMSQDQRKKLEAYYDSSVRELEEFIGSSLSELWF